MICYTMLILADLFLTTCNGIPSNASFLSRTVNTGPGLPDAAFCRIEEWTIDEHRIHFEIKDGCHDPNRKNLFDAHGLL